jgi:tetratricopeptide (TPR) repeat protein
MDRNHLSSAPGEEIIAAIRIERSHPGNDKDLRRHPRRMAAAAALLLIAALTGGGIGLIGYLSRHPLESPAGPRQAEAPAVPSVQATSEPLRPSPETSTPAPPSLTAAQDSARGEAVRQRIAAAERWVAAGDLSAAQADFQEALRLDPQSQPALAGLQGVKSRMVAEDFRRWMAEGFAALNRGDPAAAQARFLKAKALRPEAPEVKEALTQADARQRSARIEALRQKALAAEQSEDWAGALAAYEDALGMEPTLQFAQQGKERSSALVALERRIAFFRGQPKVLDSDAQLANAERLLQDIQAGPTGGSRLSAEVEKLRSLVQAAKTPVRVVIESDHLTHVAVYRVGKLGLFGLHELSLRPGTYTVVGSRDGYRDERLELTVIPGPEPIRVTIICRVKI